MTSQLTPTVSDDPVFHSRIRVRSPPDNAHNVVGVFGMGVISIYTTSVLYDGLGINGGSDRLVMQEVAIRMLGREAMVDKAPPNKNDLHHEHKFQT